MKLQCIGFAIQVFLMMLKEDLVNMCVMTQDIILVLQLTNILMWSLGARHQSAKNKPVLS